MALQIEKGKFYRTRDGRKVGPMTRVADSATYSPPWAWTNAPDGHLGSDEHYLWRDDGTEAWLLYYTESPHDLIAEWVDEYPVWSDMTPEQKGAILLAFHEGATIECRQDYLVPPQWWRDENPTWNKDCAYRVRPSAPEPTTSTSTPRRVVLRIDMEMPDGLPDTVIVNDIEYTK